MNIEAFQRDCEQLMEVMLAYKFALATVMAHFDKAPEEIANAAIEKARAAT